jgi:hypothetical protein
MNQWMYDTMVAIIQNGAPALANQLIDGLQSLIKDRQEKSKKLEALEKEVEDLKKTQENSEDCKAKETEEEKPKKRLLES